MISRIPKVADWVNPPFTTAVLVIDADLAFKIAAFVFVTLPLGVIQWWKLSDEWKARRAKRNG